MITKYEAQRKGSKFINNQIKTRILLVTQISAGPWSNLLQYKINKYTAIGRHSETTRGKKHLSMGKLGITVFISNLNWPWSLLITSFNSCLPCAALHNPVYFCINRSEQACFRICLVWSNAFSCNHVCHLVLLFLVCMSYGMPKPWQPLLLHYFKKLIFIWQFYFVLSSRNFHLAMFQLQWLWALFQRSIFVFHHFCVRTLLLLLAEYSPENGICCVVISQQTIYICVFRRSHPTSACQRCYIQSGTLNELQILSNLSSLKIEPRTHW